MSRLEELKLAIQSVEKDLESLRIRYRAEVDVETRKSIVTKAKSLQRDIEEYAQDMGIYERIEKAKQIAEDMRNKRKGVK